MAREATRTFPDYLPWSILESQSLLSSVCYSGSYLPPGFFFHPWIHERGSSVVHRGLFQALMIEKDRSRMLLLQTPTKGRLGAGIRS